MNRLIVRSGLSLAAVAAVTFCSLRTVHVNTTTVGFAYMLVILVIAGAWGFVEAFLASVAAALVFNFFFFPPLGTLTIADPQNWVALFSFLTTSLIASRLSAKAEQRARDAIERQKDLERLYTFSRATLLIDDAEEPFAKQLARKLVDVFEVNAALLYDRRTGEIFRAGPSDFDGLEDQIRDSAMQGTTYSDPSRSRVITAVRLGAEPIAGLALQGVRMSDSVLQGIANLVAIGLERARSQEMAHQIEAARQSEQLRSTLLDAMVHEFKTPLTAIRAATTSLLHNPNQPPESRKELITIADEEAEHLREFIDDAVDMARVESGHIELHLELSKLDRIIDEAVASMKAEIEDRAVSVTSADIPEIALDRRLVKLALRQLLDNALKYSPAGTPIGIHMRGSPGDVSVEIQNSGEGIPPEEQGKIFQRFYRSASVRNQTPGSGLGLNIAYNILRAHNGELTAVSRPGETIFKLRLPVTAGENGIEQRSHSHRR